MKKCIIILLLIVAAADAQTITSTCSAPDSVIKKYYIDAKRLAVRREYKINSTFKDSVRIDQNLTNTYLRALLAVYNATSLPARDSVVNVIPIHTFIAPDMNTFLITGDTNANWMKDFHQNMFPTSNATLNNLITKYALHKTGYTTLGNTQAYHLVSFDTDSCWNLLPLGNKFSPIPGVWGAGSNVLATDGWDLFDSINPNFIQLTYRVKWGDCLAGCIYHHDWVFKVYADCSVEFVSSSGNPINWQLFIGLKEGEKQDKINIFPNPVLGILNINTGIKYERVQILNQLGRTVIDLPFVNKIDVSELDTGLYFLKLNSSGRTRIYKVIKE